ncbi:hypothetical protein GIB67_025518 [Kingdonia uniflora]|uniref:F-box domain-containing protein n=1 Tax=Kingdonia uniflora TaxID=39325 RepID=A0A7J7M0A3_9MAGN|nr:hypothetical protein GIB67_025518 [Kingdonia uniflora]
MTLFPSFTYKITSGILININHSFSPEMIKEVLSRLPLEDLSQTGYVNHAWCNLIKEPDFAKMHIKHKSRNKVPSLILRSGCTSKLYCVKAVKFLIKLWRARYWPAQVYSRLQRKLQDLIVTTPVAPIDTSTHYSSSRGGFQGCGGRGGHGGRSSNGSPMKCTYCGKLGIVENFCYLLHGKSAYVNQAMDDNCFPFVTASTTVPTVPSGSSSEDLIN